MESDWKQFRDMVPKLRERYLAEKNVRFAAILTDPKRSETERFWDTFHQMERERKVLRECLDGHSRSSMWLFMLAMIRVGMLKKEDIGIFSEQLQKELAYAFENIKA
jgi:hypothetical protein